MRRRSQSKSLQPFRILADCVRHASHMHGGDESRASAGAARIKTATRRHGKSGRAIARRRAESAGTPLGRRSQPRLTAAVLCRRDEIENASRLRPNVNAFLTLSAVTLGLKSRTGFRRRPRAASCRLVGPNLARFGGFQRCGERRIRDTWPSFTYEILHSARKSRTEIRACRGRFAGTGAGRGFSTRRFPWI